MTLKQYFKAKKISPKEFAQKLNISLSSLYRYMSGGSPSLKIAAKIIGATAGEIGMVDLIPLEEICND